MAANTSLQPFNTVGDRRILRTVLDDHIACALELSRDVLASDFASLYVVRRHGGVGGLSGRIDRHDDDARSLGFLDGRADGGGIAGVEQNEIDARGNEIVDLVNLLVRNPARTRRWSL